MATWAKTLKRAFVSGSVASITSTVALALLARSEGKGALQPLNSTSHWLNGSQAADVEGADLAHTVMGYATHHAATIFWAFLFEEWLERRPARDAAGLVGDALLMSAVAAVVNYGATPKRFTPGWEFVLSRGAMAAAYGAMAVGLAVGSAIAPRHPNHRSI